MKQPLVSVVIPNYNYTRFIGEAIESALSQTYPNIEVIVVDDGSRDGSANEVRKFGARVKLIVQQNTGVSAARNRGVAESRGEFIAFLDSDDVWMPDKITKQMELLSSGTEIGLVHCGFVEFDQSGNLGETHIDGMSGSLATELLRYRRPVVLGVGSTSVVRRSVFDRIAGFDTDLKIAEDWEFCYRVARQAAIGFVPQPLVKYRIHGSNSFVQNPEAVRRMERDILVAYDKAFDNCTREMLDIKNECYGKIHSVLAGSYFRSGAYGQFIRHTLKSIQLSPTMLGRYFAFPIRFVKRKLGNTYTA